MKTAAQIQPPVQRSNLAEMYPGLDHREICQMLVRAELAGGLDVALAARGALDKVATTAPARAGKQH